MAVPLGDWESPGARRRRKRFEDDRKRALDAIQPTAVAQGRNAFGLDARADALRRIDIAGRTPQSSALAAQQAAFGAGLQPTPLGAGMLPQPPGPLNPPAMIARPGAPGPFPFQGGRNPLELAGAASSFIGGLPLPGGPITLTPSARGGRPGATLSVPQQQTVADVDRFESQIARFTTEPAGRFAGKALVAGLAQQFNIPQGAPGRERAVEIGGEVGATVLGEGARISNLIPIPIVDLALARLLGITAKAGARVTRSVLQRLSQQAGEIAVREGDTALGTAARIFQDDAARLVQERPVAGAAEEVSERPGFIIPGLQPKPAGKAAVDKLTNLIRGAEPVRAETEVLKTQELGQRAGRLAEQLQQQRGRAGLQRGLSELRGELPKAQFTPPEAGLETVEIDDLFNQIWVSDLRPFEQLNTGTALEKVFSGQLPTRGEIELLESMFGEEFASALLAKRSLGQKAWANFMEAINLPRAILSSWDFSAPLRQGLILTIAHPEEASRSFLTMFRAAGSEGAARAVDDAIKRSPFAALQQEADLYIAPRIGAAVRLGEREEAFMSRFADHIPGVRQSQRAYVTYLNKLRSDVFDTTARGWEGTGKTTKDYKDLGRYINHATGRGGLGPLREFGPLLNATFFSPRLLTSRVQIPIDLALSSSSTRKLIARDLIASVGTGISILGLLKFSGAADVELDPRSSDFGKARIGKQRLDFWAGFQPIARYVAQIITGEARTQAGDVAGIDRLDVAGRFLRSKLAPVPSLLADIREGRTFIGDEIELSGSSAREQAFNRLTPLFIQDLVESARKEGPAGAFRALPGAFGVGVQAFDPSLGKQLADARQEAMGERQPPLFGGFDDLNDLERAKIDRAPKVQAILQEMQRLPARDRVGEGFDVAEGLRATQQAEQEQDDALLEAGTLDGDRWVRNHSNREEILFSNRELIFDVFGISFDDEEAKGRVNEAIDAYFAVDLDDPQFTDPQTLEVDFFGFRQAQKAALEPLTSQQRLDFDNLILGKNDTVMEKRFRAARRVLDAAPVPFQFTTPEQYNELLSFYRELTRFRDAAVANIGRSIPVDQAIRDLGVQLGKSPNFVQFAISAHGGRSRDALRNPAYDTYLLQHHQKSELGLFFPGLYRRDDLQKKLFGLRQFAPAQ